MPNDLLYERKRPSTSDNHVGIEIEFVYPRKKATLLNNLLTDAKLEYNCHLGTDGSVRDVDWIAKYKEEKVFDSWIKKYYTRMICINEQDQGIGAELRVLCKESEVSDIITKVCTILFKVKAKVNRTCGLHVHLDMRHRDKEKAYNNLYNCQNLLYSLVDNSRLTNDYCRKLPRKISKPRDKYYGINRTALNEHSTIELRMHEGCINPVRITMWVKLLCSIVDGTVGKKVADISDLNVASTIKKYFKKAKNGAA